MTRKAGAGRPAGSILVALAAGAALTLTAPSSVVAQFPPDSLTNLRVLPEDIAFGDLMDTMRGFTRALGVRCSHCHVGEEGQPLAEYDFAADDKVLKVKARAMLRMVEAINGRHLSVLEGRSDPEVAVQCYTCHRGTRVPRTLQSELRIAYGEGGPEGLMDRYHALREEYFGRGVYDFGPQPLADVGTELIVTSAEDAVAILRHAVTEFPEDWQIHHHLGTALEQVGDRDGAIARYRRSLELFPGNRIARQRLEELGG